MKRPAFQFYPADWRKDAALQACSPTARGVWHELICVMHECEPYGHLAIAGKAISPSAAARLVGASFSEYRRVMVELGDANVYSVTPDGIIYSRRMVKDEALRVARAEGGKNGAEYGELGKDYGRKGGRPKPPLQLHGRGVKEPPLEPPPSSSSSSSSSEEKFNCNVGLAPDDTAKTSAGKARQDAAKRVLEVLNANAGRRYDSVDANINPILARMREGYTERELCAIAAVKARQWQADEKMAQYIRPKTLFNATNAAQYRAELPANKIEEPNAGLPEVRRVG